MNNIKELAAEVFGIDTTGMGDAAALAAASRALYKHSARGLSIAPAGDGIKVCGIVEGTEIEYTSAPLTFPFPASQFEHAIEGANEYLDEAEALWEAQGEEN